MRDVVDELASVSVNREDEVQAREVAARALSQLGGDRARDLFLALLASGFEPDPDDGIRGSALAFLWPDHIDAATLFRNLTLPKRDDYLGPYQRFIADLPETLRPDQLVPALEWVESIGSQADFHLQQPQHDIINRALRLVSGDDVRAVLVRIIRASLRNHIGAWYANGASRNRDDRAIAPQDRRLLARELIQTVTDEDERIGRELVYFKPPLLAADDLPWLLELASSPDERIQRTTGRCVAAIYFAFGYPTDAATADAVVSVEALAFQEQLRPLLQPVELGSELAREIAANWALGQQPPPSMPDDDEPPEPTLWDVAGPMLSRVEAGDVGAWVELVRWVDDRPRTITDDPQWEALAPHDRERMLIAALRYLQDGDAPAVAWLDVPNEFPWKAVAARSALQLIATTRPAMLDALAQAAWRKWCPVLVAVPFPTFSAPILVELIRRCAEFEELSATILRIARRDNRPDRVSVVSELPETLPLQLHAPLLQLAPELQDDAFGDVLKRLIRGGNEEARNLARAAVREAAAPRAARAAWALLRTTRANGPP